MAEIIDGKLVSAKIRRELEAEIREFKNSSGIEPCLAVIQVGDNPASTVYVRNKHKGCLEVGIRSIEIKLDESTSERELLERIEGLNKDDSVHGILVQLPLPSHISEKKIIDSINPMKDVDAFHPQNVGRIMLGSYDFLPCTPAGVMELIKHYNIDVEGKECVVLGRSNIVGKPMAHLLLKTNGTVTVCHSRTKALAEITSRADVLVVAIGKPAFVTADMVKEGATVIDVGINRRQDGKLVGDVDFDEVSKVAGFITPVPGGVGPMTITMLLKNTLIAAKKKFSEQID